MQPPCGIGSQLSDDAAYCYCSPGYIGIGGRPPCSPLLSNSTRSAVQLLSPISLSVIFSSKSYPGYPVSNIVDNNLDSYWSIDRREVEVPLLALRLIGGSQTINRIQITPIRNVGNERKISLILLTFDDLTRTYLKLDCSSYQAQSDTQTFYMNKQTSVLNVTIVKTCDDSQAGNSGIAEIKVYNGG